MADRMADQLEWMLERKMAQQLVKQKESQLASHLVEMLVLLKVHWLVSGKGGMLDELLASLLGKRWGMRLVQQLVGESGNEMVV
jgi:hypothetical protein